MLYHFLGKEKSLKNAIILILASEHQLSAKKIYNKVKREGFNVGYHAVYKALKQLCSYGVLKKDGKKYQISENWVNETKWFIESILNQGKNRAPSQILNEYGVISLKFATQIEMGRFVLHFISEEVKVNKQIAASWNFIWIPSFLSREEYEILNKFMLKLDSYILCKQKNPMDEWAAQFWLAMGSKIKLGVNSNFPADIISVGDKVIQVYWPDAVKRELAFLRKQDISEADMNEVYHTIVEKKAEINVIILKNQKIAEEIRREVIEEFKNRDSRNDVIVS